MNWCGVGLTGNIPEEIGKLSALTYLCLANNMLQGTLPSELGSLTALSYLGLYGNKLNGTLPPQIGNLTSLRALYLDSNKLSGSVSTLATLSSLTNLSLTDNNFSDKVPSTLKKVSFSKSRSDGRPYTEYLMNKLNETHFASRRKRKCKTTSPLLNGLPGISN